MYNKLVIMICLSGFCASIAVLHLYSYGSNNAIIKVVKSNYWIESALLFSLV